MSSDELLEAAPTPVSEPNTQVLALEGLYNGLIGLFLFTVSDNTPTQVASIVYQPVIWVTSIGFANNSDIIILAHSYGADIAFYKICNTTACSSCQISPNFSTTCTNSSVTPDVNGFCPASCAAYCLTCTGSTCTQCQPTYILSAGSCSALVVPTPPTPVTPPAPVTPASNNTTTIIPIFVTTNNSLVTQPLYGYHAAYKLWLAQSTLSLLVSNETSSSTFWSILGQHLRASFR